MKANELRIGNLVNTYKDDVHYGIEVVSNISNAGINEFLTGEYSAVFKHPINDDLIIKPIPLTEEWLVKFGFEITTDPENVHYKLSLVGEFNESFVINRKVGYIVFYVPHVCCNNYLCFTTQIKSIHQLQNLYFALTGEELTIK